jgi:glycosyltransferase involved in cell wall biosynthesis
MVNSANPSVAMFVRNDAARDVRVRREATSLAAAGYRVTIVALGAKSGQLPARERFGEVEIIRVVPPSAWRAQWEDVRYHPWRLARRSLREVRRPANRAPGPVLRALATMVLLVPALPYVAVRAAIYAASGRKRLEPNRPDDVWDWLVRWRFSIVGWARLAADAAPIADVYHGHDLNGLPAAVAARRRNGGRLVYDSHELFLEAGATARQPGWARRIVGRFEGRWSRLADAVVTVNESIATELRSRYRVRRTAVVRNCPPRWSPPSVPQTALADAIDVPPGTPIVLYHGGFLPDRGLDRLAEAALRPTLKGIHLVFLGFGPGRDQLEALAAAPASEGRIHVLPAVPSEELLDWVASADVAAMPNQPATLNERYSTPNKLFESIAAGTPVVSSDTPERRAIVLDHPLGALGAVCDPTDPDSIAAAIRSVLDLPEAARTELRERCRRVARDELNWETEAGKLLDLYADLAPIVPTAGGGGSPAVGGR